MRLGLLFAILLKLLLESSELGKGRIGIRFLVAGAAGAVGLGVILLAFSTIRTLIAPAARTVAARSLTVLPFGALILTVGMLLVLMTIAAALPVGLLAAALGT